MTAPWTRDAQAGGTPASVAVTTTGWVGSDGVLLWLLDHPRPYGPLTA